MSTTGGFTSSADQLETTYKLFMNTSVRPLQNFMNRELQPIIELIYPDQQISLVIEQNQILDYKLIMISIQLNMM